ncbi:type II secretion system protein N [Metapseudomonas otitidis]|uniref:type II secretion system protein N n=1 Tax=Metapseudomonas otitidis TaxID=319939 RepID=UPI0013F5F5A1|nr:type II secretion system protein N [Pseudomonas otitidis]
MLPSLRPDLRLPLRRALLALAVLALAGWLAWLAQGAWHARQALAATLAQPVPSAAAPVATEAAPLDNTLVALLFGVLPASGSREEAAEDASTSLSLVLMASLAERGETDSRALIAGPSGSAFYRIGDRLPGGAVLRAVAPDHVLLNHGGRDYRLGFPRPETRLFVPRPPAAETAHGAPIHTPETRP